MKVCPQCQTRYPDDVEFCSNDGMKLRRELTTQQDALLGRVLDGRWIIDSKIGEGGMGSVYLGRQRSVNRQVAIKTLKPELVTSSEFVDRFFREAQIATTINHPNCVTILDFGQTDEDDLLFLAMEYLEGMPLSDRLEESPPLTLDEVLVISDEVAAALEAAHSHHIVHRDLKPDNVFLQQTAGGVHSKLLDFGIAKDANASTQFTRTGQIFGTPDYMSPEQCSGHELDGRSDLYSLGCIMYEMLSGAPPFEDANSMAILMGHVTETPKPLSTIDADIPPAVEAIVLKLLEKEPADRHESATALRSHIQEVRASLMSQGQSGRHALAAPPRPLHQDALADTVAGASAMTPPPARPMARQPTAAVARSPSTSPTQTALDEPPLYTEKKSKLPLLIGGVLGVLLLVGGVTLFAMSPGKPLNQGEGTTSVHALSADEEELTTSVTGQASQEKDAQRERPAQDPTPPVAKDIHPTDEAEDKPRVEEPERAARVEVKKDTKKKRKKRRTKTTKTTKPNTSPKKGAAKLGDEPSAEPPKKVAAKPSTDQPPASSAEKTDAKKEAPQAKKSPQSSSGLEIPDAIGEKLPGIKKEVKTKSDQIVNDLFN